MTSSPSADPVAALARERAGAQWCLFLDRDGVINRRIPDDYVRSRDQWEFLPGVLDALRLLAGWAPSIVVVTNQRGVGRGLVSPAELQGIHDDLIASAAAAGGRIDEILVCPHLDTDHCPCRKPRPGLALSWLDGHPTVDASLSIMVGDSPSDLAMAENLAAVTGGCTAVLIGSDADDASRADLRFPTLLDLATEVPSP